MVSNYPLEFQLFISVKKHNSKNTLQNDATIVNIIMKGVHLLLRVHFCQMHIKAKTIFVFLKHKMIL